MTCSVFLAAPTSPDARLQRIAKVVARLCLRRVTHWGDGARHQLADDAPETCAALAARDKAAIAVGFGISNAEQFAEVGKFADAVVVGSAIVETIERNRGREAEALGNLLGSCQLSAISRQLRHRSAGSCAAYMGFEGRAIRNCGHVHKVDLPEIR